MMFLGRDYTISQLKSYNQRIEEIARQLGLNFCPQEFEICSYEDMLSHEAYTGIPSRYPHWSFGKAYERTKTFYRYNLIGLPYEMVINSNPCLAYLMKDNTLLLQVLTMAHVYGHNDFFQNNRLFKIGTRAEYTLEMFKSHARRIRDYVSDPSIGYQRVENVLDAAHALRLQINRIVGEKHLTEAELTVQLLEKAEASSSHPLLEKSKKEIPELNKIPLQPQEDLLLFLVEHAPLSDWEKDILTIVRKESLYFLPQIETKIMNEGWASYWHYTILNQLQLPQDMHLEFLKRHNQVISSQEGVINPYQIGFKIMQKLAEQVSSPREIFAVREQERDATFIRRYLDRQLCQELNLFSFRRHGRDFVITDIADEEGWQGVRDTLVKNVGMNGIPVIKVVEVEEKKGILLLEHEWDERPLDVEYAHKTLKSVARLWGNKVRLRTRVRTSHQIIETEPDPG